jgi:AraC-like DNA-binding protein
MDHEKQDELASIVDIYAPHDGSHETSIPGVNCLKFSVSNTKIPDIYSPSLCVIVQGRKQVMLENDIYQYSPSEFLAVSVDLPLIGEVIEATPDKPYLCLQIMIDRHQMSDLIAQTGNTILADGPTGRGIFVGKVNIVTRDAVLRLARLLETPKDIPILAPMILREIHYRMLNGEYGPSIAQMAIPGSHVQKIAHVIRHIRTDIAQPLRIKDLADSVEMSVSSFHYHFKAVTAMSPLQYCKRLRLTEARQIMLSEAADASSTAYRVGYESPSQFSREYARMFGSPPIRDIESVKHARQPKRHEVL